MKGSDIVAALRRLVDALEAGKLCEECLRPLPCKWHSGPHGVQVDTDRVQIVDCTSGPQRVTPKSVSQIEAVRKQQGEGGGGRDG